MATTVVEIPLQLEGDSRHREACGLCIRQRFVGKAGIHSSEIHQAAGAAILRLSYDPKLVTLSQIQGEIKCVDNDVAPGLMHVVIPLQGMISYACEKEIEAALTSFPSLVASASYASGSVRLEFDQRNCQLPDILQRLRRLGYPPAGEPPERLIQIAQRWAMLARTHAESALVLISGLLLLAGFLVHIGHGAQWLWLPLLAASAAASSTQTIRQAWHLLRRFRVNVDVMMFAAAAGAAALQHYEAGALLLFLFGLGTAGEHLALSRARNAIAALSNITPDTARRLNPDGSTQIVPVEELLVGDAVVVRPFDRIPVDGKVGEGASAVDQSAITGESMPIEKTPGDSCYAGTINGQGRLVVRTSKLAGQTMLARIVKLIQEAQTTRSPTQLFTDKVERWYVPAALAATAALIVLPPLLGAGLWTVWFYRAMAFLTAASPCALAIGTPAAVLCGIARAAREGVLIKGGVYLENLGAVQAIAFDKTGTLTAGQMSVRDIVPLGDVDASQLLALAAAIETQSSHPLAAAIVREANARGCPKYAADDVRQRLAVGAQGHVNGAAIAVGKRDIIPLDAAQDRAVDLRMAELAAGGNTVVIVARDGRIIGLLALADQPRPGAAEVLASLHRLGIRRTIMLSGDHALAAEAVARIVGIDETFADLLPEDKLRLLDELSRRHGPVAMVGDGVNDAPALAQASVGIAMGGASADAAIEAADVVLMSSGLDKLPMAIALSRFSRRIIAENLLIAIGVIAVVAPMAARGLATLPLAVVLHEGSTVIVVLNSLRLLRFRNPAPYP